MIDINRLHDGWQVRSTGITELAYLKVADGWQQHHVDMVENMLNAYAGNEYADGVSVGELSASSQAEDDRDLLDGLCQYKFDNGETYDLTDPEDIARLYNLAYPKS